MKNEKLVLISSDRKAGGISVMIGIHTAALIKEGYKVNVILSKHSDAVKSIASCTNLISNKANLLSVYQYSWLDFILLKFVWFFFKLNNLFEEDLASFFFNGFPQTKHLVQIL